MIFSIPESRAGLTPDQFEGQVAQAWQAVGGVIGDFLRRAFQAFHLQSSPMGTVPKERIGKNLHGDGDHIPGSLVLSYEGHREASHGQCANYR